VILKIICFFGEIYVSECSFAMLNLALWWVRTSVTDEFAASVFE